jgi:hypothetical protein
MIDNREAMAYVLYRELNITRERALALVDEQVGLVVGLTKLARHRWRKPRRRCRA